MGATRRLTLPAAAVILLTAALSACGVGPHAPSTSGKEAIPSAVDGPVTINFWERYCDKGVAGAVQRFNQANAGKITVNDVCVGGSETNLVSKIRAAAAGGGLPDIATASEQYITGYDKAKLLVPLDPYEQSPQWGVPGTQRDDFYPGAIARTKLSVYGGRTLSWPFGNTANALYVNLDLLHRAGIAQPPSTWQEFRTAAEAIKRTTGKPGWVAAPGDGADLVDAAWTTGTPWISPDGTRAQLGDSATTDILRSWQTMFADGTATASNNYKNAFTSGEAGMVLASTGYATTWAPQIKTFPWQAAMLPHATAKPPVTELFGSVDVVFRSTPQRQLAAWLFAKYLASAENQAQMCPIEGCIPATRSSVSMTPITQAVAAAPQYGTTINDIAPHANLLPQGPALADIRGKIAADVFTRVTTGQLSPEAGTGELQDQAQQAIDAAR